MAACAVIVCACGTSSKVQNEYVQDKAINVGYGSAPKSSLTTSVSQVDSDKYTDTYTNMYDYLRGRVPGVQVVGDKIIIRGLSSINSSTDPLVLMDGIEISDISSVPPSEVESVSVIKDASSAIYGMRGANGVILITSKSAASAKAAAAAAKKAQKEAAKERRKKKD